MRERERVDRESDRERERFSQISKIVKIVKKDNTFIIIIVIFVEILKKREREREIFFYIVKT